MNTAKYDQRIKHCPLLAALYIFNDFHQEFFTNFLSNKNRFDYHPERCLGRLLPQGQSQQTQL